MSSHQQRIPGTEGRELVFAGPREAHLVVTTAATADPGHVVCRTVLSAISHGTEMALWRGTPARFETGWDEQHRLYSDDAPPKRYPVRPGYETVARVEHLGPGVSHLRHGDLVWLDRPHRQWHTVPQQEALRFRLPTHASAEAAVFVALARVALTAVHDGAPSLGASAAVVGLGTVGLLIAQAAAVAGCGRVIAADPVAARRAVADRLGIEAVDPMAAGAAADIKARTANRTTPTGGADVVFEASGTYAGLETALRIAAPGGRIVCVSTYPGQAHGLHLGREFQRNRLELVASMSHNDGAPRAGHLWDFDRLMTTAMHLVVDGLLQTQQLVTHRIAFEEAPKAYDLIDSDPDALKIVLTYDGVGA